MTSEHSRAGEALRSAPPRTPFGAMLKGWRQHCPACGQGRLYGAFLKVVDRCGQCGEVLSHHRADDAPPYMTILIVGHIVVAGALALERAWAPETWVHMVIWLPLTLLLSLLCLPRVKGVLIGLQWALRMHGFGSPEESDRAVPTAAPAGRT